MTLDLAVWAVAGWLAAALLLAVVVGGRLRSIVDALPAAPAQTERAAPRPRRQSPRLGLAARVTVVAMGLAVIGLPATASAAAAATPGSWLWSVRLVSEDVRLALSSTPQQRAAWHLRFADELLGDLEELLREGELDAEVAQEVVARLQLHTASLQRIAGEVGAGDPPTARLALNTLARRSRVVLGDLQDQGCTDSNLCAGLSEAAASGVLVLDPAATSPAPPVTGTAAAGEDVSEAADPGNDGAQGQGAAPAPQPSIEPSPDVPAPEPTPTTQPEASPTPEPTVAPSPTEEGSEEPSASEPPAGESDDGGEDTEQDAQDLPPPDAEPSEEPAPTEPVPTEPGASEPAP